MCIIFKVSVSVLPSLACCFHFLSFQVNPEPPFKALDSIISAELPWDNPSFHEKVKRYMIHHQNHLSCAGSRCNHNGHCIYNFPHSIHPTTTIDESGHVQWHQREEEDAWVVPHCPMLLDIADCYFHFKIAFTAKVFTYLYKYLYKGPNITFFTLADKPTSPQHAPPANEIQNFPKARYLSAPESTWHILGFNITHKEPSVDCLPVHLLGENIPQFHHHAGTHSSTSLLNWYFLHSDALTHLQYEEYFEQFVLYPFNENTIVTDHDFIEKDPPAVRRKKASCHITPGQKVVQITTITPNWGEIFYIHALLLHHPATSFKNLHTINSTLFHSFHCQRMWIVLG